MAEKFAKMLDCPYIRVQVIAAQPRSTWIVEIG